MDRPGEKLRRARERLKLTYRDVAEASREIAGRRGAAEFRISLGGLAQIENGGRVPSVFRIYALCAIYRLDFHEVLRWYGVPVESLAAESLRIGHGVTHAIQITGNGYGAIPQPVDTGIDQNRTTFLSSPLREWVRQWGSLPLNIMGGVDRRQYRYGLIGLEDRSMFPILRPGSLVQIDEERRRIAGAGWSSEFDRPIYFLEHRDGYACGWCTLDRGRLVVLSHPASEKAPRIFRYPDEIEVLGQVVGVAMLLGENEPAKVIY